MAFGTSRALIKARFPPLLPYLCPISAATKEKENTDRQAAAEAPEYVPTGVAITEGSIVRTLPLSDNATKALLQYIETDILPVNKLSVSDISALLAFGEECGSIRLKILCARKYADLDLSKLGNLGEAMVVAKKFGMIQLERKAIHYFVALLPYSLSLLPHLPSDVLLHYSVILGRLVSREDEKDESGTDSIWKVMNSDENKVKELISDTKKLSGLI